MKKLVKRIANCFGFDVVRSTTFDDSLGDHLKEVIARHRIDTVIDVGANKGGYGQLLRRLGFRGQILSFEPVLRTFDELEAAARSDRNWHCFRLALGDEAGEKNINAYSGDVWSSFLNANDFAKKTWIGLDKQDIEPVLVARLEDIIDTLPGVAPCRRVLLKLDTQGFDVRAFRGCAAIMDRVVALQSEVAFIALYQGMDDPYHSLSQYRNAGFVPSAFFPINRDSSLAVIEFDCVMVIPVENPAISQGG